MLTAIEPYREGWDRACSSPDSIPPLSRGVGHERMVGVSGVARQLASELREHEGRRGVYVLAVAPESLRLAAEIASILRVPLDLFPVQAFQVSRDQASPVGIVGSGGVLVVDQSAVASQACSVSAIAHAAQAAARALAAFERELRDGADPPDLRASTVILVDDGRTDVQMLQMAIVALRRCWVKGTVLATPTIRASELELVRKEADMVVSAVVDDRSQPDGAEISIPPPSVAELRHLLGQPVPLRA
jgi:putative phosphoribosyl transferase